VATAIKAANPELTVIAESGDGDMYGEGGNHFLHAIRRNPNITNLVHNNMVYGLTKGQASPTSPKGLITPIQVAGVTNEPFNPLATAIALGASFVARAFSGDIGQTKELIKRAINHQGYALVDIFQPCVSFNKLNTHAWFKEHTYYLDDSHDPTDRQAAFAKSIETDRYPLGLFYLDTSRNTFEQNLSAYRHDSRPLFQRETNLDALRAVLEEKTR
jgi:2-oxoglutarate ferredoxin oxidoreductase subunit beta